MLAVHCARGIRSEKTGDENGIGSTSWHDTLKSSYFTRDAVSRWRVSKYSNFVFPLHNSSFPSIFHLPVPNPQHILIAWASLPLDQASSSRGVSCNMSHRTSAAQLRALRASRKSRLDVYQVEDHKAVYEEVDEEGYKNVVRGRLNQDDFVVDDKGEGYADDGREEWQNERPEYSSDDAEDVPLKGAAAKRKREEEKEKTDKTNHKILSYFNAGQTTSAPKPKVALLSIQLFDLTL